MFVSIISIMIIAMIIQLRALHVHVGVAGANGAEVHVASIIRNQDTANIRTNIMDFRGSDSSTILIVKGWYSQAHREFPEILSQAILVGIMLVGRVGVCLFQAGVYSLGVGVSACARF